jgi:GNAT superfamily N-acetyltransferase
MSWHPGGLGWALAREQFAEVVLFGGHTDPVAWVARGMHVPGDVLALADPSVADVADAVATWLRDTATPTPRTVEVSERDAVMLPALRRAGFQLLPGQPVVGMHRSAAGGTVRDLGGYVVRPVRPEEISARVEVHRAAWRPASLPYAAHHQRRVDPGATSSFSMEAYEAVRRTWLYDPALDLVVEAPDGSLVACCIAWFDPATGVAEIEPLGVAPEHRRRGLAGALCLAVATRVGELGGREVFINTGPRPEYPAPGRAYAKVGFETFNRARSYELT